jgi:hypothetical protein
MWLGQIPCSATDLQGTLRYYVNAKNSKGEIVDNFGTQKQPFQVQIVEQSSLEPPAHPGRAAPARCGATSECPPEMIGTPACPGTSEDPDRKKSWNESCEFSAECESGLFCREGLCQSAPSCEKDTDCDSGRCVDYVCDLEEKTATKKSLRNWVGLHFGADFAYVTGEDVCLNDDYRCFYGDGVEQGSNGEVAIPGQAGRIDGGFAPGSLRVLLSYEHILPFGLGMEARAGAAFSTTPTTGDTSFFPVHAEGRLKYWFIPPGAPGFHPYVHVGGGIAQVDGMVTVRIGQDTTNCTITNCPEQPTVEAYNRLGTGFVTGGAGALLAFQGQWGLNVNLNAMYTLPASALVLEPALGFLYGF